jgi:hypothetical protein
MSDYDSPYKELIDRHLRLVLSRLFPEVYADIDWTHEVESLDAELQQYPEGKVGKRLADKLVKVRTLSGDDRYLHLEVQGDREDDFERRMFIYQYRGDDRFGLPMEALVILADESPSWRPTKYLVKLKRTSLTFQFKPVKLLS